eukprot:1142354-Pelagomonas_calceolata.AAC.4
MACASAHMLGVMVLTCLVLGARLLGAVVLSSVTLWCSYTWCYGAHMLGTWCNWCFGADMLGWTMLQRNGAMVLTFLALGTAYFHAHAWRLGTKTFARLIKSSDEDIEVDHAVVSLKCPLTGARVKTPARFSEIEVCSGHGYPCV